MPTLTTFTRKQLSKSRAKDFKEGDLIDVLDKNNDVIYTINISYGEFKSPLRTTVVDKDYNLLGCTPGTKGGWPYYIANFIQSINDFK